MTIIEIPSNMSWNQAVYHFCNVFAASDERVTIMAFGKTFEMAPAYVHANRSLLCDLSDSMRRDLFWMLTEDNASWLALSTFMDCCLEELCNIGFYDPITPDGSLPF